MNREETLILAAKDRIVRTYGNSLREFTFDTWESILELFLNNSKGHEDEILALYPPTDCNL